MSPQMARLKGGIVTVVASICMAFLQCVSSNVSSNCLFERMHSHIDCICFIFLHCVLSNVASNSLSERMHSHIGHISLTFPHCLSFSLKDSHSFCLTKYSQGFDLCYCESVMFPACWFCLTVFKIHISSKSVITHSPTHPFTHTQLSWFAR